MGDSFQSFALPEVAAENAAVVAAQLSDWLIAKRIVREDGTRVPAGVAGFGPGDHAEDVMSSEQAGWRDVAFKDVHVDARRCVTAAVLGGLGPVFCPTCKGAMGDAESLPPSFVRAADEWSRGQKGMLTCPACEGATPIAKWRTEPYWAFANVTVTFWNWPPIKDAFIRDVEAATGGQVKAVRGKL